MTRFVFDTAVTLNGFLATEDHSLEWLVAIPNAEEPDPALLPQDVRAYVMGSHTYEWLLRNERLVEEPQKWSEYYGATPVLVFTSRQLPIPEGANVRLVSGAVSEHLEALRAQAGDGTVWVMGGGDLVGQFADANALDVVALTVAPATLSSGAPVLPRTLGADRLTLKEARQAGPFARLVYEVSPAR